jgi:hypothetical protein
MENEEWIKGKIILESCVSSEGCSPEVACPCPWPWGFPLETREKMRNDG